MYRVSLEKFTVKWVSQLNSLASQLLHNYRLIFECALQKLRAPDNLKFRIALVSPVASERILLEYSFSRAFNRRLVWSFTFPLLFSLFFLSHVRTTRRLQNRRKRSSVVDPKRARDGSDRLSIRASDEFPDFSFGSVSLS